MGALGLAIEFLATGHGGFAIWLRASSFGRIAISRDSVGIIWGRLLLLVVVGSGAKESEKVGTQGGGFGWKISQVNE